MHFNSNFKYQCSNSSIIRQRLTVWIKKQNSSIYCVTHLSFKIRHLHRGKEWINTVHTYNGIWLKEKKRSWSFQVHRWNEKRSDWLRQPGFRKTNIPFFLQSENRSSIIFRYEYIFSSKYRNQESKREPLLT